MRLLLSHDTIVSKCIFINKIIKILKSVAKPDKWTEKVLPPTSRLKKLVCNTGHYRGKSCVSHTKVLLFPIYYEICSPQNSRSDDTDTYFFQLRRAVMSDIFMLQLCIAPIVLPLFGDLGASCRVHINWINFQIVMLEQQGRIRRFGRDT